VVREDGPATWSGEYASPSRQTEETKKRFLTPFPVALTADRRNKKTVPDTFSGFLLPSISHDEMLY
jgi:hypothetical protein